MYAPAMILSENSKTGRSINLPIAGHCRPTKNCSKDCYAKTGYCAMPNCTKKQLWLTVYLAGNDITQLIKETRRWKSVRLSATGDINEEHVDNIIKLAEACPDTMLWGMSRKLEIADAINNKLPNLKLMVSVDSSSPQATWDYQGALCFGPRRSNDVVPRDVRIVTVFPLHIKGKVDKAMPKNVKDCPAVLHKISGCSECGRCWRW
jgi:hypothetical protein